MRVATAGFCLLMASCGGLGDAPFRFTEVAEEAGLDFWHFSGARGDFFLPEITGSGVALVDYDTDGDLDILFLQGRYLEGAGDPADALRPPPSGWQPGNRLYRNDLIPQGQLRFVDVTAESGDLGSGFGMGVAVGDYDGDSDPDLYLTGVTGNVLLRNDGARYTDVTKRTGVADQRWNVAAAFVDVDQDGDLDLYSATYLADPLKKNRICRNSAGAPDYCSPSNFDGLPDRLLRNDAGIFVDISEQSGVAGKTGAGLGVVAADFNGDNLPDLFVANDQTPNHLWINRGAAGFEETALLAGTAYNGSGQAEASMGVTAADHDGDGDLDLFMTHLTTETNTLYRNDGTGVFLDATDRAELGSASIRYTGWGTRWFDADHDGDLDLFVANGAVMGGYADSSHHPYAQRNQLYLANGGRYESVPFPGQPENSRGAAFGDIDNDGDIDIVVSNNDGPAELLLNSTNDQNWLTVELSGQHSNGSRVALLTASGEIWRRSATEGSYASASDHRVHFGLGENHDPVSIGVVWADGTRETWRDLAGGQFIELVRGTGKPW